MESGRRVQQIDRQVVNVSAHLDMLPDVRFGVYYTHIRLVGTSVDHDSIIQLENCISSIILYNQLEMAKRERQHICLPEIADWSQRFLQTEARRAAAWTPQ